MGGEGIFGGGGSVDGACGGVLGEGYGNRFEFPRLLPPPKNHFSAVGEFLPPFLEWILFYPRCRLCHEWVLGSFTLLVKEDVIRLDRS